MLLASVALVASATAVAAQDDLFCRQLRGIIDGAGRGFDGLRGAQLAMVPDDGGGDDAIRYAATRLLPGATACGIDESRADGDPLPPTYLCWFAPTPTSAAAIGRIARQVVDCVGHAIGDHGSIRSGKISLDVRGGSFLLSVTAGNGRPVILAVSST